MWSTASRPGTRRRSGAGAPSVTPAAPALGRADSSRHLLGRLQAREGLTPMQAERFAAALAVAEHHTRQRSRRPCPGEVWAELAWTCGLDHAQRHRLQVAERDLAARLGLAVGSPAPLNRPERLLERDSARTGGLSSLLAGASRQTRLAAAPGTDAERLAVLAGVGVPALVGYGSWLVDEARRRGLRRLHGGPAAAAVLEVTEALAAGRPSPPEVCRLPWDGLPAGLDRAAAAAAGLLGEGPWGVVEVGWTGALAGALATELPRLGGGPPAVSYSFGLAGAGDAPVDRRGYLFDRVLGVGPVLDDHAVRAVVQDLWAGSARPALLDAFRRVVLDPELVDVSADLRPTLAALLSAVAPRSVGPWRRARRKVAGRARRSLSDRFGALPDGAL